MMQQPLTKLELIMFGSRAPVSNRQPPGHTFDGFLGGMKPCLSLMTVLLYQ